MHKLASFKPSQICVEIPISGQAARDSLYNQFLTGSYQLKQDEIDQLAFRTAQKLQLKSLSCVNYYGRFETEPVKNFAQDNNQSEIMSSMDEYAKTFLSEVEQKQKSLSLREQLIFLNSPYALHKNAAFYTKYYVKIGKDQNYVGTDLVADWYNTNLHIYTNIVRKIQPTDKAILVIFGQGHIPILKHLFETNLDFEVVEKKEILE